MSLTTDLADEPVPSREDVADLLFSINLNLQRAEARLSMGGPAQTVIAGALDNLTEAKRSLTALYAWAYNECLVGD